MDGRGSTFIGVAFDHFAGLSIGAIASFIKHIPLTISGMIQFDSRTASGVRRGGDLVSQARTRLIERRTNLHGPAIGEWSGTRTRR
jgi:hypothetical protein